MVGTTALMPSAPARAATSTVSEGHSWRILDRVRSLWGWLAESRGHGLWIAFVTVALWTGTLLAPFLTDQPFLIMLLAPRAIFVAIAADSVAIVPFVLLGTLRLMAADASYFILGRRIPRRQAERVERTDGGSIRRSMRSVGRAADATCQWLARRGPWAAAALFLRPNARYLGLAGAYGVSARVAGIASVLGTIAYLTFFHMGIGVLL